MTAADLLTLRDVLTIRRRGLIDRIVTAEEGVIEPAFVALLAATQTAIAAVDAELAEQDAEVIEMEGGA
jgi:hypothetical protein